MRVLTTTKPNLNNSKNKNHNNNYFNKTISLPECDLIKISLICRSLFVFSKLIRTQPINLSLDFP